MRIAIANYLDRFRPKPITQELAVNDLTHLTAKEIKLVYEMEFERREPQTDEERSAFNHFFAHREWCSRCPDER
jgi:hypothetical protein